MQVIKVLSVLAIAVAAFALPAQASSKHATKLAQSRTIASGPDEQGQASWYGNWHTGRRTANGERFDPNELTAAHRTLPMNTRVQVLNLRNGKTVTVRINDRLPPNSPRIIDLTRRAAAEIGMEQRGHAPVLVEALNTPRR
jgi:rare lipoprotein A